MLSGPFRKMEERYGNRIDGPHQNPKAGSEAENIIIRIKDGAPKRLRWKTIEKEVS